MSFARRRGGALVGLVFVCLFAAVSASAQISDSAVSAAAQWLITQQAGSGSWGVVPELSPRDTARSLIALQTAGATTAFPPVGPAAVRASNLGIAWLTSQPLDANQLLAEQAIALSVAKADNSAVLAKLLQQRSSLLDLGGFADHSGDAYDSALAVQALATNETLYGPSISTIVTSLLAHQNPDGGWGIDGGFASNPLLTAEVLLAFGSTHHQIAPPVAVAAAQAYLIGAMQTNGSIAGDVLTTAVGFRALVLSRAAMYALPGSPITYLRQTQGGGGWWGASPGDPYVTARVIEAFSVNKPNLTINPGDFTLSPATVVEGGQVTATVKVSNIGTVTSGNQQVALYTANNRTATLATFTTGPITPGSSATATLTFSSTGLFGATALVAVADAPNQIDESREDDNEATATLTVTGKPDLQIYRGDISTSPAHLVPGQPAQILATIHNGGQSDAPPSGYAVYQQFGSAPETLLVKAALPTVAAGQAQTISVPATFSAGSYAIRVVADPDNVVNEVLETNNQATLGLTVSNVGNIDMRMSNVVVTPSRPAPGTTVAITALLQNTGIDPTPPFTIAFYDGVPGAGGTVISTQTLALASVATYPLQITYTTTASSQVIYAVADPDNLVPELDETNNSAFALLTDQVADLEVTTDGIVLPRQLLTDGQTFAAKYVVRNRGLSPATHVEVTVYDDLPQLGGKLVADTFVDVPAQGSVVVPASWPARAGQRLTTVTVNATRSFPEPNYANNRATRPYVVNGLGGDITISTAVDVSELVVDPLTLQVSGSVILTSVDSRYSGAPFVVTVFEDVDGDRMFNPEVDNSLGSTLVPNGSWGSVTVAVQGTVRFAPGHLMAYIDSGNAINEGDETNNLLDVYHPSCAINYGRSTTPTAVKWTTNNPSHNLSPVARVIDTNGDGVIDDSDALVMFIGTAGGIVARRADTGAVLWSVPGLDTSGRQISPVVADLGDGKPVVIAHTDIDPVSGATHQHRLVALNAADGSRKWTSPTLDRDPQWELPHDSPYSYGGAPAVADLNGDGIVEVICGRTVLNGLDGTIEWTGTGGAGRAWNDTMDLYDRFFPDQEAPIVVDVDGDGRPDVVAGNTVYRADGSILWQRSDLSDGYTSPVWLGTDTTPHICLVAKGTVTMLNSDGTTLWGPLAVPGGSYLGGAPTTYSAGGYEGVGGTPAVAVANDGFLTSFNAATGGIIWTTQVSRDPSQAQGSTTNSATAASYLDGFEFLFYVGLDQFVIVNGLYGGVQYADTTVSANPYYPSEPVVADIDDDGHLEVVVPDRTQVRIYGDGSWMGASSVFNEASYHTVNTDEFGKVPHPEVQTAFSRQNFRASQVVWATNIAPQPNLTASYPRIDSSQYPGSAQLLVRIGNNGWAAASPSSVDFYQPSTDGSAPTHLGTAPTGVIAAGGYQDVAITVSNPPASLSFYAVVDVANTLAECDEGDNTSATTTLASLNADIAAAPGTLAVSDAQPRQGDAIDLAAEAFVTGAHSPATVTAQFFLGDPAKGGTAISPVLPVTVVRVGTPSAIVVSYHWAAVTAPVGQQAIYVMFDPQNVIPEGDETNNTLSTSINVTSPDPVRSLSGTVTLTPPSAEAGTPVRVDLLVQNIGNVTLSNAVLTYAVTGGPASGATGSATIGSIAKSSFASVTLGSFTPSANGTYTVTLASSDPATTLQATPKTITIGPFATGLFTATPSQVPISFPLVQAHAHVSRTNTVVVPDDPLLPLVQTHVQQGINFTTRMILTPPDGATCMKCHVHPQGLIAINDARSLPGVTIPDTLETSVIATILSDVGGNTVPGDTASMLGGWALSHASSASDVAANLPPLANVILKNQQTDGSWPQRDDGNQSYDQISYVSTEGQTLMAVDALSRIYQQTKDQRLADAIVRAERWLYAYDYTRVTSTTYEYAARVAIALHATIPYLDSGTATLVQARISAIASFLRAQQNADGSFGDVGSSSNRPITRTAQSLYAISLDGAGPSDPAIRAATLWLLNHQGSSGSWPATNQTPTAIDQTRWAITALSLTWGKTASLDVDFHLTLPAGTDLVSTASPGTAPAPPASGTELIWHLPNVTETGSDVYANLMLNGLQNGASRQIATEAWLTYSDPYSGQPVRQELPVPTITGTAPVGMAVSTDVSTYGPNQNVVVSETVTNAFAGLTNDMIVRDATGTAVATLASAEPLSGVPVMAFPGWHYAIPVTVSVDSAGPSRVGMVTVDFSQKLAELGVTGTFDTNSLRVTADAQPFAEDYFTWTPSVAAGGSLTFAIPDGVAVGTTYPVHIFFDITENGFKPATLYDRNIVGGGGLFGAYYRMDTARQTDQVFSESQVAYVTPPVVTRIETTLILGNSDFPYAAGLPQSQTVTIWTGGIDVPVAGTYGFDLASDDGSWLTIDGVQLINNGGNHGTIDVFGSRALTAGFHSVRVTMYQWGGGQSLSLKWAPPGQGYAQIPSQYLFPAIPLTSDTVGGTQALGGGPATKIYTWNTASTAAGPYTAEGTIRQSGTAIVTRSTPFTITPGSQITAAVATGSASYDPGTTAQVTGTVLYASGNVQLTSLSATLSVTDPAGATDSTGTTAIATLVPGQSVNVSLNWSVGNAPPGTYTATLVVKDSSGNVVAQKSVPFSVRSSSQTGKGISGTITATTPTVPQRQPAAFTVSLTNGGNAGITNGTFAIRALDPVTQAEGGETAFTASLAAGATITVPVSLDTTPLSVQAYDVWLVSTIGSTVTLAKTSLTVTTPPVVTATVTTDKTSYDAGDTLHATTAILYASGTAPLVNVTVATTVTDASNATVSSGTGTIASIAPGASTSNVFDWPVGGTAPGTYTTTIVVKDNSGAILAQSTSTFTIVSTATSGKGLTGTLTAGSPVTQGALLTLNATITNNGNAALTNAPFAIQIASATVSFTASVPLAGSTTSSLSDSTASLAPGSYTATLVSMITGTPVTLATATFTVNAVPVAVTASTATDKSAYDVGDSLHETTTVQYTSGAAPLTNATVTVTVTDAANATVSTSTSTIASLAPGATTTTTFNWPVATTAPGTYTITAVVKDSASNLLAQKSSTFTITSTATSGKGVTGTLTASASVTQGDVLPLSATITDSGNAALTNAPFAIQIGSDSVSFTASVPLAGSTTSPQSYNTTPLAPGNYTATLVSMITGAPVTLATASFTVNSVPVVVTATAATDKSAYDVGDTVHETTTVQFTSGPAPLANATVAVTVTNAVNATVTTGTSTIASLAPGTTATATFDWSVSVTAPGTYTTTIVVKDNGGAILTQSTSTFTIVSTATSGKGVTGTLTAGSPVTQGVLLPLSATITNNGNAALTNAPFVVQIVSASVTFTASVPLAGSTTSAQSYNTASLAPGSYTASLVSMITGTPVTLGTAAFTINAIPVAVTATTAADKSAYDVGDTLHETTTVQYTSGPAPLTNATVAITVTNAANATVTTGTSTIASLAPGATTTTTFNWPVTTTAPGTYTITAVVKDSASNLLTQKSSTFTITSTATSGKGVTGTLMPSSPVTQGALVALSATINDNGNAALTNAPFAIQIASATVSFTASVPLAGSTTSSQSYNTTPLAPGTYTATLVSMITGTPVTLGTAGFTVTPVSVVVTATVALDKSAYDVGDTLHETTTVQYTSGSAALTNATVAVTVTNAANATVSSGSSTIASLAPGATTTTTFNWPVTTTAPGTYTITAVVKSSTGTVLAQKSSTFTITSTASSGKGVSGTLTTSASVTQGDVLPLSATITDNGNAALTNASFAVQIGSASVSFTASVPLAGSTTSAQSYNTTPLAPGTYTATLVSMITGSPVTLATASFTVKQAIQPTLAVSPSSLPRVLLRQECNCNFSGQGNDDDNCGSSGSPFFTKTLTGAGIPYSLLHDGDESLLGRLRAGGYTEAVFARPDDATINAETSEMIHAGVGVIVVGNHSDDESNLSPALGTKLTSNLNASSTLLSVLATPISPAGHLTVNGNGVKMTLTTAKAAANIAATGLPALSYNAFGSGKTVVIPFNVELTTTPDMAAFLLGSVNYVTRPASSDARSVAAVDFAVTAPTGGSQSVKLTVTLPSALTLVAANPSASYGTTWNLTVPGGTTTHVVLRIRLADAIGSYNVSGTIAVAGQPLSTKTITLAVTADLAAMEAALTADLAALANTAPSKEQHIVADAQKELAAIHSVKGDDQDENNSSSDTIQHILKIVSDLDSLSVDTAAARRDTDRLFLWWESRVADQQD